MSYPAPLQSMPSPLRAALKDPFAIAALVSIGAHGLIWALLPVLSLSSAEPPEPEILRKVEVVELSPAEASRIPNFDGIPATLPPVAAQPPLPNDLFTLSPLPPQPPIPSGFIFSPPPDVAVRGSSRTRSSGRPTTRRTSPSPSPSPPAAQSTNPTALPERLNAQTTELRDLNRIAAQPAEPDQAESPSPSPSPTPSTEPNAGASPNASPNPSPAPSVAATPSASPDAARRERLLAERQQLIERYRELYTYNPQGTSADEAKAAYEQWLADLDREEPASDDVKLVQISEPLPREACRIGREVAVTYGVLVSPEDERIGNPQILQRSGFRGLDRRADELIAAHDFSNATPEDQDQVNYVTVTFTYDRERCPNAPQ